MIDRLPEVSVPAGAGRILSARDGLLGGGVADARDADATGAAADNR